MEKPQPSDRFHPRSIAGVASTLGQRVAVSGFVLYSVFAPHSIAGSEIALAIASAGWLIRTISLRRTGFRHTNLDLPIWLFFTWTLASAIFSSEPRISLAKLQSVTVLFVFYLTQAIVTRRTTIALVALMLLSGVAGTVWSALDLVRGRGVVVESISGDSPFLKVQAEEEAAFDHQFEPAIAQLAKGDAIWRVGGIPVSSVHDIDEVIRRAPTNLRLRRLSVSVITHGEHAEWPGILATNELQSRASPSGITSSGSSHRFRASGWTRHYEYFAEILQILAQLSLGLALANFQNHGANRRCKLAIIATAVLAFGIAFTAMRTALVAFAIGAGVVAWRAARRSQTRLIVTAGITFVLGFGAVVVWQTRATHALHLEDASSTLRVQVARAGLSRIMLHPVFGHGMDAVKAHWSEWGFPGHVMVHLHSTPLQIAFDRGLPALIFWIWIMYACWRMAARAEKATGDSGDTNRHGVLLGATGALAGFLASSLVNYNFGAGIVALTFWWLLGVVSALAKEERG